MRLILLGLFSGLLVALMGCGESKHTLSGTVTYNDEAIPEGQISFVREGSATSSGGTITNGQYKVSLPPGKYRVQITASKMMPLGPGETGMDGKKEEVRQYIPSQYNTDTKLTADIPGTNPLDFKLKSP